MLPYHKTALFLRKAFKNLRFSLPERTVSKPLSYPIFLPKISDPFLRNGNYSAHELLPTSGGSVLEIFP
jgi:hypothetical protein